MAKHAHADPLGDGREPGGPAAEVVLPHRVCTGTVFRRRVSPSTAELLEEPRAAVHHHSSIRRWRKRYVVADHRKTQPLARVYTHALRRGAFLVEVVLFADERIPAPPDGSCGLG